jgi:hypothetical protein
MVDQSKAEHCCPNAQRLASLTLLTPWMIWKQQNDYIFNNARPSVGNLVNKIK